MFCISDKTVSFFPFIFVNVSVEAKKQAIWTDVVVMGLCSFYNFTLCYHKSAGSLKKQP